MTWVDGDRWEPDRAKKLVDLLVAQYRSETQIAQALQDAAIDLGVLEISGRLDLRWFLIVKRIHQQRRLRALVEVMRGEHPQLQDSLEQLTEDPLSVDGNPPEIYDVQILGFARRPLIDRQDLRASLRTFLSSGVPVFVIRGGPRTGKSFSYELIQHVTRGQPDVVVRHVDFSPVACGDTAADLMAKLCLRLGLPDVSERENRTTRTRFATELVDAFVGQYITTEDTHRVIVIDGLNRSDLQADVYDLVAQLATEVVREQLPRTQLVLTGYAGGFDRTYDYGVLTEDVERIGDAHVRAYFQQLVIGRTLRADELDDLVRRACPRDDDNIEELARRVRDLTLDLLEPTSGGGR